MDDNNFMLWNLPITDDIEAKRSVFGRFITWNYKNALKLEYKTNINET